MSREPSPSFLQAIKANLAYWHEKTSHFNKENIRQFRHFQPNLLRAIEFGLAHRGTQELSVRLLLQAFAFVEQNGAGPLWLPLYPTVLDLPIAGETGLRFTVLKRYGQLLRLNRQLDEAIRQHQEAEKVAHEQNDSFALAVAQLNLSEDFRLSRQYEFGERWGRQALAAFRALADTGDMEMIALNTLALMAQEQGQLELAETRIRAAIDQQRIFKEPINLARYVKNLAIILQYQRRYSEAEQCYQEALTLLTETASDLEHLKTVISLGSLYFAQEKLIEAETAFREADSPIWQQAGDLHTQAIIMQNLGNVLLHQGRYTEADVALRRSETFWLRAQDELFRANTVGTIAELLAAQGRKEQATNRFTEALTILEAFPNSALAQRLCAEFSRKRSDLLP